MSPELTNSTHATNALKPIARVRESKSESGTPEISNQMNNSASSKHNRKSRVGRVGDVGAFVIEIRPEPHEIPAANRLRKLLKVALRSFGMRCTSIAEKPAADGTNGSTKKEYANHG